MDDARYVEILGRMQPRHTRLAAQRKAGRLAQELDLPKWEAAEFGAEWRKRNAVVRSYSRSTAEATEQVGAQYGPVNGVDPYEHQKLLARFDLAVTARKAAERDNRKLRMELASREEMAREIAAAIDPIEPLQPPKLRPSRMSESELVLALSDWHIGEVVKAAEMGGSNAYWWELAREGVHDIIRRVVQWVEALRGAYKIERAHVFVLGDMVTGNIHDELRKTNEFPAPVAVAKAGGLLAEAIATLAGAFSSVDATCIAGNHPRLSAHTPAKATNFNSLEHLVYVIAAESLSRHDRVRVSMPEDPIPVVDIRGRTVAAMHGHQIKAAGVSPYYGIARRSSALARERQALRAQPPDHILIGHFHHFAALEDSRVILAPSLIGPTEWSRQAGFGGMPGQFACLIGDSGLHGSTVFERRIRQD